MTTQNESDPIPLAADDLLAQAIPIEEEVEAAPGAEAPAATQPVAEEAPAVDLVDEAHAAHLEIRKFDRAHNRDDEDRWKHKAEVTGKGARHVRTFVSKLRLDAIEHMDASVNLWLDQHPDLEVKFVTSAVGILTGKLREEAIFMSVWV